jgi:hypothetical protein
MTFLVYGNSPFLQADICEILDAAFQDSAVSIVDSEEELFSAAAGSEGPLIVVLILHDDIVRLTRALYEDPVREGAVILVRNEAPSAEEASLPLYHVNKPFSEGQLVSIVKTALYDLPVCRS